MPLGHPHRIARTAAMVGVRGEGKTGEEETAEQTGKTSDGERLVADAEVCDPVIRGARGQRLTWPCA